MDFNDINSKLKRLYSLLDEQFSTDFTNNTNDSDEILPNGRFIHRVTFGNNDLEKNQNIIMNVIHSIASLKDIINRKLKNSG